MKRAGVFILICLLALILSPYVQAQTRSIGTNESGYVFEDRHTTAQTNTEPCPAGTYVRQDTYRQYGPEGLVSERISRHCVPYEVSAYAGSYRSGHSVYDRGYSYEEGHYFHPAPPSPYYPIRHHIYPPAVAYHSPYYHYNGPYYGGYASSNPLVGGAFGAAAGAAIGAILGDPGEGAAIGAVIGGLNSLSHGILGYGLAR